MKTSFLLNIICLGIFIGITRSLRSRLNLKETVTTGQTRTFTFLKAIPRLNSIYTQGMFFTDDGVTLIESGGLYGSSKLVSMNYASQSLKMVNTFSSSYFAEGTARCGNYVYVLTWKERRIFKFSYPDLIYLSSLTLDSRMKEGWGLATLSQTELIASDGTSNLYILDCSNNLVVKRIIPIYYGNYLLTSLNALNYSQGFVWANVYFDKKIYKISLSTGRVITTYDMTSLVNYEINRGTLTYTDLYNGYVLNGIAYNPVRKIWVVTGKEWGYYFEVVFN